MSDMNGVTSAILAHANDHHPGMLTRAVQIVTRNDAQVRRSFTLAKTLTFR